MAFSFECGTCNSTYTLDESQISHSGVKITCPKCFNFFILKKGFANAEAPMVEKLAEQDGAFHIHVPAPLPGEITSDELLGESPHWLKSEPEHEIEEITSPTQDKIPSHEPKEEISPPPDALSPPTPFDSTNETQVLPQTTSFDETESTLTFTHEVKTMKPLPLNPPTKPFLTDTQNLSTPTSPYLKTSITLAELGDYPEEQQESGFEKGLVWLALLFIVSAGVLLLNYYNLIDIPFLQNLKAPPPPVEHVPAPSEPETHKPKYGFPVPEELEKSLKATPQADAQ